MLRMAGIETESPQARHECGLAVNSPQLMLGKVLMIKPQKRQGDKRRKTKNGPEPFSLSSTRYQ